MPDPAPPRPAQGRLRFVFPAAIVAGVGLFTVFSQVASGAQTPPHATKAAARGAVVKAASTSGPQPGALGSPVSGYPTSSPGAVAPSGTVSIGEGYTLFQENCASCHGSEAAGSSRAPNLQGLGEATVDFWVSTGRMPLAISSAQAVRKAPRFDRQETLDIVAFVHSLDRTGPGIPKLSLSQASLSSGANLFAENCAGCHTITGAGDALGAGTFAPSLHQATPLQVAEAVRTGPGNMPQFGPGNLSPKEVDAIVKYVTGPIQHPANPGGLGLGGIGPVAEGFIGLLLGVGGLMAICFWIGDRA